MKIIKDTHHLERYIPNTIVEVEGETPFIEKISAYIDAAENWVIMEFLTHELFDTIANDENDCHSMVAGIVACEALKRAIPSLDIVLSPTGFGVVNSGAIAPASRDRVERLIAEMESTRDGYIQSLISILSTKSIYAEEWRKTDNGKKFGAILPYSLDLPVLLGFNKNIWVNYLGLRTQIIGIESYISQNFISEEYMCELREKNFGISKASAEDEVIIERLISIIIKSVREPGISIDNSLYAIIDFIRKHIEAYPTWAQSDTARLFSPQIFTNKQENNGYFF